MYQRNIFIKDMTRFLFVLFLNLLFCGNIAVAQSEGRGDGQRSSLIRAFENYAAKGQLQEATESGVRAATLYYKENLYKESFDLLRRIDQSIYSAKLADDKAAALHYLTTKERMQMYVKLKRGASAKDQLDIMERHAAAAGDENLKNDLLYAKTIYYYTFGENAKGNAVFKEMAARLTNQKEYDKVDKVYQTLIANGRKSGNANLVAQSYDSYIVWKDSVNALKVADETGALKQQIADNEQAISEKDGSLATRKAVIAALCVLLVILVAVLVLGAIVLMRFVLLTRKQKKTIALLQDNNALKAKFIGNISAQLEPTLKRLDQRQQEVKAMIDFTDHIQLLSELENSTETPEMEDTQVQPFCEELMNSISDKVKTDVVLTVNAPKMSVQLNRQYVSHVLLHLLKNAAEYTPEGGHIRLEFKKRSAHTQQFLITDTGCGIAEERREEVFKPFHEIKDLTAGDGLGLPICKQMAMKMGGDLTIDSEYIKGTRFVLSLHQ